MFDKYNHRFDNEFQESLFKPTFDHKHIGVRKCKDFLIYSKQSSRIDTNHQHVDKLFKNAYEQAEDIQNNKLRLGKLAVDGAVLKVSLHNNSVSLKESSSHLCGCRSLDLGKENIGGTVKKCTHRCDPLDTFSIKGASNLFNFTCMYDAENKKLTPEYVDEVTGNTETCEPSSSYTNLQFSA